jgi:hypothetical protein
LNAAPAILINNAPGLQVEFTSLESDYKFAQTDCNTFGEIRGQGLHLCVGARNSSLKAGTRHGTAR